MSKNWVVELQAFCMLQLDSYRSILLDNFVVLLYLDLFRIRTTKYGFASDVIIQIGHREEIRKLVALRRSWKRQLSNLFMMLIHINPVDKTKLSCNTLPRRNTTVSLETYPLIQVL